MGLRPQKLEEDNPNPQAVVFAPAGTSRTHTALVDQVQTRDPGGAGCNRVTLARRPAAVGAIRTVRIYVQHGRPDPPACAGELPSGAELDGRQGLRVGTMDKLRRHLVPARELEPESLTTAPTWHLGHAAGGVLAVVGFGHVGQVA